MINSSKLVKPFEVLQLDARENKEPLFIFAFSSLSLHILSVCSLRFCHFEPRRLIVGEVTSTKSLAKLARSPRSNSNPMRRMSYPIPLRRHHSITYSNRPNTGGFVFQQLLAALIYSSFDEISSVIVKMSIWSLSGLSSLSPPCLFPLPISLVNLPCSLTLSFFHSFAVSSTLVISLSSILSLSRCLSYPLPFR